MLDGDALDPIGGGGALIRYARASPRDQNLDRQARALKRPYKSVFADKKSGKGVEREQLSACLDYMRAGDTLVVASPDRLDRFLRGLISIVVDLRRRGSGSGPGAKHSTHHAGRAAGDPCVRRTGRVHSRADRATALMRAWPLLPGRVGSVSAGRRP
ncbi:recombinase family protein [Nocardia grenadensis]|uniref:recombinase family protein n=1 Tax=Nocardia grenadensis TaxID=931537 RepID=UPI003D761E79